MKLTPKQEKFCDYYIKSGNASEAYKEAGYSGKSISTITTNANRMLINADIMQYIRDKNDAIKNDRIADMQEVKEFWTNTLRDNEVEMRDRIKVSELIGKTNAAFVDKVELTEKMPEILVK